MKMTLTLIIQVLLWGGYTSVLFLSHHDHVFFEWILFLMFAYFNFLVALRILNENHLSLHLTLMITALYLCAKWLFAVAAS
jgi:hypothetical protein